MRPRTTSACSNPATTGTRSVAPGDPAVLIVEDDARYQAKELLDLAREKGFKGIVTHQGDSALTLARDYLPTAIVLDIDLPDTDGFTVLERLKRDPSTRHIPVHVILSRINERERGCARARSPTWSSR
jgi:DNA-binding response OmpR family regulator